MGVATVLLADLRIHGWGLKKHDAPRRFVEPMIGRSVIWYCLYRTFAAVFVALVFLIAVAQCTNTRGLMHFPVWGYTISLFNSVLFAVCVINHRRKQLTSSKVVPAESATRATWSDARRSKRSKHAAKQEVVTSLPMSLRVVWVTHYISVYSIYTSVIFQTSGLFKGEENVYRLSSWLLDVDERIIHAVFAVYTFVDFWVIGITVRLLHFYITLLYAVVYNLALLIDTVAESSLDQTKRSVVQYDVADFNSPKRSGTSAMFFFCFALLFPITIHLVYYVLYLTKLYIYDAVAVYMRARKARLTTLAAAAANEPENVKAEKDDGLESPTLDAETTVHVQENILDGDDRRRSLTSTDKFDSEADVLGKGTDRRHTMTSVADSDSLPGKRRMSKAGSGDVRPPGAAGHRTSRSGSMMESRTIAEQLGLTQTPLFEENDFTVIIDPE